MTASKIDNFQKNNCNIFHYCSNVIYCGYSLELCLFVLLRLNISVNKFSVMSGWSNGFQVITSTYRGVNVSLLKDFIRTAFNHIMINLFFKIAAKLLYELPAQ